MRIQECYQYVTDRLNKLSTNNSQNIPFPQFVRAFNTSQLQWFEDRVKLSQTNRIRIDEIQQFTKTKPYKVGESILPDDYFHFITAVGEPCNIRIYEVKDGDLPDKLRDEFWKPSETWKEGLLTISGDKINIYGDFIKDFTVKYYRLPREVDIQGYKDFEGVQSTNIDSELKGTSIYEVLDLTVKLLGSDVSDQFRYTTAGNKSNQHT